jgi:DNA-binding NtrC family response regulator
VNEKTVNGGATDEPAKPRGTILLVDDEAYVRDSLSRLLGRRGFAVRCAASVAEALQPESLAGIDAVLVDLKLAGEDGLTLVRRIAADSPSLPVVVLTGHGTVRSAVEGIRAGAFDYLLKPADPDELTVVLERALEQSGLRRELAYLRSSAGAAQPEREPLGISPGWRRVIEMVELAAPADTSVLLLGESGSGKEEVAKLLHRKSGRAGGPFVKVNCAAIPGELFESEFFGHRRGAFTGAVADRDGRFRIAHGGTLLLDEIDTLPPAAQAKVLRVIEDGEFERVGESRPTSADVRLITATNVDLPAEVDNGRFRSDLYYRINVLTVYVPPLRERREDIALLARAFLHEQALRLGRPVRSIHPAALAALETYSWPGNVRELRNVIERGVLLERGEELTLQSLPFAGGDFAGPPAPGRRREPENLHLREALAAEERRLLEIALVRAAGVRREAARLLGIDERNLAYFLKKHGLMRRGKR